MALGSNSTFDAMCCCHTTHAFPCSWFLHLFFSNPSLKYFGHPRLAHSVANSLLTPNDGITETLTAQLAEKIGQGAWRMWFDHAAIDVADNQMTVTTDSKFAADWISRRYQGVLDEVAQQRTGKPAHIAHRITESDHCISMRSDDPLPERSVSESAPRRTGQRRYHRLDELVVGPSNRLAWTAAKALVEDPDARHMSPLFVYGACGVGKTHLLQGICEHYRRMHPGEPIRYVTGEAFTNEYIQAVRHNQLDRFRKAMRRLQLLAIDDIHFVQGKTRTQDEILHTLDTIQLQGARLVLASDAPPSEIRRFNSSLVSRLTSGMLACIEAPDPDLRRSVVERIATARGLHLDPSTINDIVERCPDSVRQIHGLIARITAVRTASRVEGVVGRADVTAASQATDPRPCRVTLNAVIEATCSTLQLETSDLKGRGRAAETVLARGVISLLARELTTASYPEIAAAMNRRTHSTVHAAERRMQTAIRNETTCRIAGETLLVEVLVGRIQRMVTRSTRQY